jgi:hypothetical protein
MSENLLFFNLKKIFKCRSNASSILNKFIHCLHAQDDFFVILSHNFSLLFFRACSQVGDRLFIGAPGSWYWQGMCD